MAGGGRDESARGGLSRPLALDRFVVERSDANGRFFDAEAERIALLCRELAERFVRGGRLLAVGASPQTWSDAHHVAVEFVHPVIVGKRALPALAVRRDDLDAMRRPHDAVVQFEPLRFDTGDGEICFEPPTADPFIRQELCETLYHVVWELVHVFFEHLGASTAGAGQADFLYPFLGSGSASLDHVVDDVRRSVLMKSEEVSSLREQTLGDGGPELAAAAVGLRNAFDAGGMLFAFGNGGSATDAADVVADFRAAPQGWPYRRAIDLAADSAILTALANDIGPDVLFQRQVIAYGGADDVVLALSTSGDSTNACYSSSAANSAARQKSSIKTRAVVPVATPARVSA